jgi:hypothetical protein
MFEGPRTTLDLFKEMNEGKVICINPLTNFLLAAEVLREGRGCRRRADMRPFWLGIRMGK